MRVASKVRNFHSEFGHVRPLGSPVIRYLREGRTKANLIAPSYGRGRNNFDKLMYVAYVAVIIFYIIRCHLITTNSKLSDCFASSDYITYVP